jgi:MoaA/NifB/PqqE/SkfB family radical SAM enzyme
MSVDTMHKIPDTFCPAKWDELYVGFDTNYAYACCKSQPTKFNEQVLEFVTKEQINLLNGVKDASCDYCWATEQSGGESLRQRYLKDFNPDNLNLYTQGKTPAFVQVTVGNECNFQCTYCNPKFSSKWEQDVSIKEYKVFSDRYFWGIDSKNAGTMDKNIEFLKSFDKIQTLSVIGGEPLLNKKTFELLDSVEATSLQTVTNLSCKQSVLNKLFAKCQDYKKVTLVVSIDATDKIAEFTRYGLSFADFDSNFRYLLANRPKNLEVIVNSVMTSITVRDIANFGKYMTEFLEQPNFEWRIEYCKQPVTQSLATLPDAYKDEILLAIDDLKHYNIWGMDTLKTIINSTPFNKNMHQQMKHFMNEFANRKNITIPLCLD